MLILGDYYVADFTTTPFYVAVRLIFATAMVFVSIVLLNLLIAIMGNSFERILESSEVEAALLRAKIILEMEIFIDETDGDNQKRPPGSPEASKDRCTEFFPRYLHLIVPDGAKNFEDTQDVLGQNIKLRQEIHVLSDKLDKMSASRHARYTSV